MSSPYLGEIKIAAFNFPPKGWAYCNGQFLPISQNQALYSLIGTTYGGDGVNNFALPDFRGRVPVHWGNGIAIGQSGGAEAVTLTTDHLPAHTHAVFGNSGAGNQASPAGNYWAGSNLNQFTTTEPNAKMAGNAFANAGSGQPHENRQPYWVLNFIIALEGVFPTPN